MTRRRRRERCTPAPRVMVVRPPDDDPRAPDELGAWMFEGGGLKTRAPRTRWEGREYFLLGWLSGAGGDYRMLGAVDDVEVTLVPDSMGWSSGSDVEVRREKCGRFGTDVQPDEDLAWVCAEYCGWQADVDAGRWGE